MTAKAQHTPGPWAVEWNGHWDRYQLRSLTHGSFGHFEGWSADGVTTEEEDQANAEHIVRAVNNFDELLAACKQALAHISGPGDGNKAMDRLNIAIAKAEGQGI